MSAAAVNVASEVQSQNMPISAPVTYAPVHMPAYPVTSTPVIAASGGVMPVTVQSMQSAAMPAVIASQAQSVAQPVFVQSQAAPIASTQYVVDGAEGQPVAPVSQTVHQVVQGSSASVVQSVPYVPASTAMAQPVYSTAIQQPVQIVSGAPQVIQSSPVAVVAQSQPMPAGASMSIQQSQVAMPVGSSAFVAQPTPVASQAIGGYVGRYTIPPALFAKLASGEKMTPEEISQLTGQPAPPQPAVNADASAAPQPVVLEAPATTITAPVQSLAPVIEAPAQEAEAVAEIAPEPAKSKKSKSLKASKKKTKGGCC